MLEIVSSLKFSQLLNQATTESLITVEADGTVSVRDGAATYLKEITLGLPSVLYASSSLNFTPANTAQSLNLAVQTAGNIFAAPAAVNGSPSFRALVATDIPGLDASKIISGTFSDTFISSAAVWNAKQDALVSGTNIKTVGGQTILGSGDITLASLNYWTKTGFVLSYESTDNATGKATFNGGFEIYSTAPNHSLKQRVTMQTWRTQIGANTGAAGGSYYSIFNVTGGNHGLTVTTDGNVAIGTLPTSESSTNSRLYVYGGNTGANIDVRGLDVAFKDQATLELQGSEYSTAYSSTRLQHRGANYGTSVSILGLVTQNFGELTFQEVSGAVIRSTNTTPILVGINNLEVARFLVGGFKVTGSIEYSTTLKPNGNAGTSGYFLKTTGTANSWSAITLADISDYSAANVNYWTLAGGNVYRSTGKVFVGHSEDMGAYSFQVTGDSIFSNKVDVRGIVGIGAGYSSTNAFTIESTLTGGANHATYFRGNVSGTNDAVIWDLSRAGGAYGEFAIDFGGTRRFYLGGSNATPHSYIMPHTNFGVGTTNPLSKAHIFGNLTVGTSSALGSPYSMELLTTGASPTANRLVFGTDGTGWKFAIGKNQGGVISDLMTFQDNGFVGINLTSPSSILDIKGGTDTTLKIRQDSDSPGRTSNLLFTDSSGTTNVGGIKANFQSGEVRFGAFVGGGYYVTFYTNNLDRGRIDDSGRFIIGTTTSGTKLFQVNGGIRQNDVISGLVYANSIGEFQSASALDLATLPDTYIKNQNSYNQTASFNITGVGVFNGTTPLQFNYAGYQDIHSNSNGIIRFINSAYNASNVEIYQDGGVNVRSSLGVGTANDPNRAIFAYSNSKIIGIEAQVDGPGALYAIRGISLGVGTNHGGFFYAVNGATNYGVRIYGTPIAADNYAIFSDATARSYFAGSIGIGTQAYTSSLDVLYANTTASLDYNSLAIANFRGSGHVQLAINSQITGSNNGHGIVLQAKHSTANGSAYDILVNPLGGSVGIGTLIPAAFTKLHVVGLTSGLTAVGTSSNRAVLISNSDAVYGLHVGVHGTGASWFQSGRADSAVTYDLWLQHEGGNVILGNTGSTGAYKLQVIGSIYGSTLTGSTVLLKTVSGVITRAEVGDLTGLVGDYYIKNQYASAQTANYWIDGSVTVGPVSQSARFTISGSHSNATFMLFSQGNNTPTSTSSLSMWASEPGITYDGCGIGANINGSPGGGRRESAQAQSYIRFWAGSIFISASTSQLLNPNLASWRFDADATFNWGSNAAHGQLTWDTGLARVMSISGNRLIFGVNGTDINLMTLTTSGKVLIGTVSENTYKMYINGGSSTADGLYVNGKIFATDDIQSYSDRRLKENFKDIIIGNKLKNFKIQQYNKIGSHRLQIGVIAQELAEIFPQLVSKEGSYFGVSYSGVATLALGLGIENKNEIENLKEKVLSLQKEIEDLKLK